MKGTNKMMNEMIRTNNTTETRRINTFGRRIFAVLLAFVMMFGSAMPAFAGGGQIEGAGEDEPLTSIGVKYETCGDHQHKYIVASNGAWYMMYCEKCLDQYDAIIAQNHEPSVTIDGVEYTVRDYYPNTYRVNKTIKPVVKSEKAIKIKSISLNRTNITDVENCLSTRLTVYVNPTNANVSQKVTWTSSNPSVASVKCGIIETHKAGTAIITATCGGKKATCKVTVKAKTVALNSISLNKSSMSLTAGKSATLSVKYNPTNTTVSKNVTWKSSNTKVATVSGGKITAKKAGTATITATCNGKTATCKVTVKAKTVALKSISLNKTSMSLTAGKSATLSVKYNPTNTTVSKNVTWKSSNTKVATVSGGKITAKKAGTATITATCNGKTATCKVTVKAKTASKTKTDSGSYMDVSEAYTLLNKFRTTKANQWYWTPITRPRHTHTGSRL